MIGDICTRYCHMIKKITTAVLSLALIAAIAGCSLPPRAAENSTETVPSSTAKRPKEYVFDESPEFSLETDGIAFTNEELLEMARKRYIEFSGQVPDSVEVDAEDGDVVYISMYFGYFENYEGQKYPDETYRVDRKTGVGYDSHNYRIDLTGYV